MVLLSWYTIYGQGCTVCTIVHSLHPPTKPSWKGIGQQNWHQQNSQEMGISSVSYWGGGDYNWS